MSNTIIWDTLYRKGQLQWKTNADHRKMLERFAAFYKGTVDEQILTAKYPGFLEAFASNYVNLKKEEVKTEDVTTESKPEEKVEEEVKPEKKKKNSRHPSSS